MEVVLRKQDILMTLTNKKNENYREVERSFKVFFL